MPQDRNISFILMADRELSLQSFLDVLGLVINMGLRQGRLQTEMKR